MKLRGLVVAVVASLSLLPLLPCSDTASSVVVKIHHRLASGQLAAGPALEIAVGPETTVWNDFVQKTRVLLGIAGDSRCIVLDAERSEIRGVDELEPGQTLYVEEAAWSMAAQPGPPPGLPEGRSPTGWGGSATRSGEKQQLPDAARRFDPSQPRDTGRLWSFERSWSTPIYQAMDGELGRLNPQLQQLILHLEKTTPTVGKSNFLGWQSSDDMLELPTGDEAVKALLWQLRGRVYHHAARMLANMAGAGAAGDLGADLQTLWFNVNRKGSI